MNVNLAPVADVPRAGSVMATPLVRGRRARRRGAHARGRAGHARRERGLHRQALPGPRGATVNTDDGPATVRGPVTRDLVPFRAAIAEGVPLVMLSHAAYPALDANRIASQSRPIVTGLLRRKLGFGGVIVTDSLEAARCSRGPGSRRPPSGRSGREPT